MKSSNSFSSLLIISTLLITIKTFSVNCQSEYFHPVLPQAAALVAESFTSETALPTVTVRGFLNFRTTVDGTVIVFTPASAAATAGPTEITPTSPPSIQPSRIEFTSSPPKVSDIKPTSASSRYDVKSTVYSPSPSFNDQVSSEPVNSGAQYPTGLVTVLGGTVVLNGATTVHETKVIGTYINGKYAQILKSTSHVKSEPISSSTRPTEIKPSASVSVIPSARPRPSRDSLKSESSESVRRVRPLKVLESSKKEDDPKETEGGNSDVKENKVQLRRPTRIGTRLTYAPRENPRVRLNRFKVKVAASSTASPTSREKVEEEAAKEINQRFQKRLGIGRSGSSLNSSYRRSRNEEKSSTPSPAPREEETRDTDPQSLGSDHGSEISSGSYSPPLFDQNDPLNGPIDPSAHLKQVQTVTSEITHHLNGSPIKADTVTTVDEPIHPSARLLLVGEEGGLIEPTEPLPLNGNEVTGGLEIPPIVLSRTYDLTEHVSRTTVVPVFDGTASANHTITESFVIRKLITAYKTMPFGDSALLATASAEMANGTALLDGLEASEQNLEPSLLGGAIELTSLPEDGALINGKATSALLSAAGLQTLDPSTGFGQNGFNSPLGQNLPPFDLSNPLVVGAALRNPALAAMYLGLQNYHNQQPDQPQYETITRPTEVVLHETVYNTKVLSFYDGRATRTRTIVEPASTIDKTITTVTTQVTPRLNTVDLLAAAQAQQFQRLLATQLLQPNGPQLRASSQPNLGGFPGYNLPLQQPNFNGNNFLTGQLQSQQLQHAQAQQQQQQQQNQQIANGLNQLAFGRFAQPNIQPASTITHTYTTVTDATSTQSKIYTLKYNAFSTKYRTVTSTSVYPTTVTTTSTIVVQPSLGPAFNPFFG